MIKFGIAADHAGYELKEELKKYLAAKGYEATDYGTHSTESMDYPDVAHPLGEAIEKGEFPFGIAICGSGRYQHDRQQASGCKSRSLLEP